MRLFIVKYDLNGRESCFFVKHYDRDAAIAVVQSLPSFAEQAKLVDVREVDLATVGIIG